SAMVEAVLPRLVFYTAWEMRVINATPAAPPAVTPGTPAVFVAAASVSCTPISPTILAIMPPEVNIPIRPGPDGTLSVPTPGSTVLVAFANGDAGKPYILALDPLVMPTPSLVGLMKTLIFATETLTLATNAFAAATG